MIYLALSVHCLLLLGWDIRTSTFGAFGELSSNFVLLMKGLVYEGALEATRRFGWNNYENQQHRLYKMDAPPLSCCALIENGR